MDHHRRSLLLALLSTPLAAGCVRTASGATPGPPPEPSPGAHDMDLLLEIPGATGHAEKFALLLYPGFTLLDVVGPHHVLVNLLGAEVHLVGPSLAPVMSDTGIALQPTTTLRDCPGGLTALMVPGGTDGTVAAMEDPPLLDFLATRAGDTPWVTSVCTGSLVLGAAGLLRGFEATSHWVARDILAELGATPRDERVVRDRNRLTGGGVTAGIDLALELTVLLRGRAYAEVVQLFSEYAPAPPVDAGTPDRAPPAATLALSRMLEGFTSAARSAARRARQKWS